MVFNVFHSIKYTSNKSDCLRIDATDIFVECDVQELTCKDSLEICLTQSYPNELENEEVEEYGQNLEAGRPLSRTVNSRLESLGISQEH